MIPRSIRSFLSALVLVGAWAFSSGLSTAKAWDLRVTSVPPGDFTEFRLAWVGAANDDAPGLEGESLLFARALFSGTQTRPGQSWMTTFQSFGGELAVLPGESTTEVSVRFPEENLAPILQLLGDALTQPGFNSRALLDLQDQMIREVYQAQESAAWNLERGARFFLYPPGPQTLPFGGTRESLLRISPQDLFAKHALWIRRGNLKLAVRSSKTEAEIAQALDVNWSAIPEGDALGKKVGFPVAGTKPWSVLYVDSLSKSSDLSFYLPGAPLLSSDRVSREVLVNALLLSPESKFQEVLRASSRGEGVSPQIRVDWSGLGRAEDRDSLVFVVRVSFSPEVSPGLIARLWQVIASWDQEPWTSDQLAFGKERVKERYAPLLSGRLSLELTAQLAGLGSSVIDEIPGQIAALSSDDLRRLQASWFRTGSLGLSLSGSAQEFRPLLESVFGADRLRIEGAK